MNELSGNIPSDFDKAISTFHVAVEKLYSEQPKNVFEFIYRRITTWSIDKSNQKISQDISNITKQAENILKILPDDMHDLKSLKEQLNSKDFKDIRAYGTVISKADLQQFCNDMDRLFQEIYPRAEISPFSKANKMPKLVQEYLSTDVKNLRAEKKNDTAKVSDEEHKTKRKIAKGKLAIELGGGLKKNTGSTGTLIILDVNGKEVGIHKVTKKDVPVSTKVKNFFKRLFGGQLSYLSNSNYAQPMAERASYVLSKELGFNLAPSSKIETIKGFLGVFQVFITREKDQGILGDVKMAENIVGEHGANDSHVKGPNDYRQVEDILPDIEAKSTFTEKEKALFQKMAIFDYLIGNLDRHEENWLVTLSAKNEITNIKAIDNANAFPKIQPEKNTRASKYQYHWKSLKISRQEFTLEVEVFVKNRMAPDKIQNVVVEIQRECGHFLDEEMKQLLFLRAAVIYKLISEENNKTPTDLAALSTKEEMLDYCYSE